MKRANRTTGQCGPEPRFGYPCAWPGPSEIRALAATLVAIATTLLLSCGDSGTDPVSPPAAAAATVLVTPASATLGAIGETVQFTAEVRDLLGRVLAGSVVAWSSSDASVASVDAGGLVTAAGNGTATITATSGAVSGTASVTVAQVVNTVTVTPPMDSLVEADTLRLSAEAVDANGHTVAGAEFAWASANALVAVVDGSGLVTGVAAGEVEITATASGVAGSASVVVLAPVPTTVEVTPDSVGFTALGETAQMSAEVRDQLDRVMSGASVAWASSDVAVAMVDASGLVTAAGNGMATITATSGSASGTATVTVAQQVSVVAVSPPADTLVVGDTLRLTAVAIDTNGHPVAAAEFEWTSSDTLVARVDDSGLVTGVSRGRVEVEAASSGFVGRSEITVPNRAPLAVDSISSFELSVGDAATVDLSGYFADPDGDALTFEAETSHAAVVSVSVSDAAVTVVAVAKGTATVAVTASDPAGLSARQAFAATVANRAPLAVDTIPALILRAGQTTTVDLSGHFADPDGDALTFEAETSDAAVVSVSVSGAAVTVAAVAKGTATVTVTAFDPAGLSARQRLDIEVRDRSAPTIMHIDPPVLVEGETATISGWGFSPSRAANYVYVGGLPAPVLSAAATRLSVTVPHADCLPPREVVLRVSTAAGGDSVTIGATPLSGEELDWDRFDWRHTSAGDGCIHLPGSARGGEYLIGVTSVSEDPSSLARVTLTGIPGDPSILGASKGPSAPRTGRVGYSRYMAPPASPSGRVRPPPSVAGDALQEAREGAEALWDGWHAGHSESTVRNQALIEELGRPEWSAGSSSAVAARSSLAEGDTLTLNTAPGGPRVKAVVRLVGDHTVWLEDVTNPAGTFTDAELVEMDELYSAHVKPVNDEYFGGLSDVDGNGRLLVLMTVEINRRGYGGEVNACDLYPRSQCRDSNEAEIFYAFVPDPDGIAGHAFPKEFLLRRYPALLTHEVTHLVQAAASVFGEAPEWPRKWPWEWEGGATMAESLVGHRLFGHASGQNLGYPEWNASQGLYWYGWTWGLFDFFSGGHRGAPEECSWLTYKDRDGNDGPCGGDITYGVSQLVLRFAMDRWGGQYSGGESALLKRFTQSPRRGFASLVDVSPGWSVERILGEFYATLWLEGTVGLDTPGMTSWDIHDIVSHHDDSLWLEPYSSSSASPSVSARIRAGSSMYFHWTPDGPLRPTSFNVEATDGDSLFIWAIRAR